MMVCNKKNLSSASPFQIQITVQVCTRKSIGRRASVMEVGQNSRAKLSLFIPFQAVEMGNTVWKVPFLAVQEKAFKEEQR